MVRFAFKQEGTVVLVRNVVILEVLYCGNAMFKLIKYLT